MIQGKIQGSKRHRDLSGLTQLGSGRVESNQLFLGPRPVPLPQAPHPARCVGAGGDDSPALPLQQDNAPAPEDGVPAARTLYRILFLSPSATEQEDVRPPCSVIFFPKSVTWIIR